MKTKLKLDCAICFKRATCVGSYENRITPTASCDDCCGHGNEDGHCDPLGDFTEEQLLEVALNGAAHELLQIVKRIGPNSVGPRLSVALVDLVARAEGRS